MLVGHSCQAGNPRVRSILPSWSVYGPERPKFTRRTTWSPSTAFSRERILLNYLTGSGEFPYFERKTDSESVGFGLIGIFSGRAKLHVAHSKDDNQRGEWGTMNLKNHSKLFSFNNLAERVGFEFTRKRSFNNIERTAGSVKQWKTVVSSANGSQTDHSLSVADHPRRERYWSSPAKI